MEEMAVGFKPIEGVNTSTVGFLGMAEKGHLNKPTLCTSWAQFVDKFGRYTRERPYLAPAVSGFFANGARRCYVARVKDRATDEDYVETDRFLHMMLSEQNQMIPQSL